MENVKIKVKGRFKKGSIDMRKGVYLLPNICTTASLFLGFYSIIQSISSKYVDAAWAIVLAGVFDLFDGRIARLARAESKFGVEFDSLADLVSFGIAPAILIYKWSLVGLNEWGWFASFLYLACGTMRLARFNVQHKNIEQSFFQGLPIPVAALVLVSSTLCFNKFFSHMTVKPQIMAGFTVFLAFLMISTIKYRSLKYLSFRHRLSLFALTLVAVAVFIIAVKPAAAIFLGMGVYVISGLLELIYNVIRKLLGKPKTTDVEYMADRNKIRTINGQ